MGIRGIEHLQDRGDADVVPSDAERAEPPVESAKSKEDQESQEA